MTATKGNAHRNATQRPPPLGYDSPRVTVTEAPDQGNPHSTRSPQGGQLVLGLLSLSEAPEGSWSSTGAKNHRAGGDSKKQMKEEKVSSEGPFPSLSFSSSHFLFFPLSLFPPSVSPLQ
ncbi:hypothetical protein J4Q44_G00014350 [Coregonus suidteri]|uniref:Uncharacterized protein n=1 Tax=Coregonus suidteri TaxID=861788 RepID=A0AAN8MKR3_9TELE